MTVPVWRRCGTAWRAVLNDPKTAPRDLAAVSREYRLTVAALAALAPAPGTSKLDEIAARRRKRGA